MSHVGLIYALAGLVALVTIELLLLISWSGLISRLLMGIKLTLLALFDPQLGDLDKEVALRKAAFSMLGVSFKALLLLTSLIAVFYADDLTFALVHTLELSQVLVSASKPSKLPATLDLLILKSVIAMLYWALRVKYLNRSAWLSFMGTDLNKISQAESDQAYSEISKALHDLALDSSLIANMSFQLEKRRYLDNSTAMLEQSDSKLKPVWVCGLARAGTTILTDVLYETGAFTSLTYRQMPFPLAPNLWKGISRWGIGGAEQKVERAHGDGLLVNIDSPEALEEVFWRAHESQVYQHPHSLSVHEVSQASLLAFEEYLSCLSISRKDHDSSSQLYLSKNNNHLLRLPSLLTHFPQAKALIPLREPLEHAESLRRQHIRWVERHQEDEFSLSYMNWLAHHEFGLGHKPFSFGEDNIFQQFDHEQSAHEPVIADDPMALNYWLIRWLEAYTHIESILSQNPYQHQVRIIDYQTLSTQPHQTLTAIFDFLELSDQKSQVDQLAQRFKPAPKRIESDLVPLSLLESVNELYHRLHLLSEQQLRA